jgi:glycosyltransferase involved in cell wall biosynthesis
VVEAMACGAPVAYSAGTAMEEIATGLGRAVPALDVDGWTAALRDALAGDEQFDPAARDARIARAQEFDWTRSAAAVVDAYRRIIPR